MLKLLWKECDRMPNMSGHMAVAKKVSKILDINSEDFYRGNLLPDLYIDKKKSHYKIKGKKYMIPDIDYVVNVLDLKDEKNLGYLTHLLLDKYYLEEYLMDIDCDVFEGNQLYKDYDILNKDIVEYFKLDTKYLTSILSKIDDDFSNDKLKLILECLLKNEDGKTTYLDKEKFINFLDEVSLKIAKEIEIYI